MTYFIAKPFNLVMLTLLFFNILVIFLLWFFLHNKSERFRRNALLISSGLLIFNYLINRFIMFNDPSLLSLWGQDGYIIRELLPFQLCGLGMIFIPIALISKNEVLYSFCFVVTPLAAALAIIYPPTPYNITPIYNPSYFTFYFDHALCIINGISLVTLGLYTPKMRLIAKTTLFIVVLAFIAHLINLAGAAAGFEGVNYFYSLDPSGSGLLELFWSWCPYPYLYLLLYIPVLLIYYTFLIGFVRVVRKIAQHQSGITAKLSSTLSNQNE